MAVLVKRGVGKTGAARRVYKWGADGGAGCEGSPPVGSLPAWRWPGVAEVNQAARERVIERERRSDFYRAAACWKSS